MSKKVKCVICGNKIKDRDSNNPRPVKYEGRCCDDCDKTYVLPMRVSRVKQGLNARGDQPYMWSERRMTQYLARLKREGGDGKPVTFYKVR